MENLSITELIEVCNEKKWLIKETFNQDDVNVLKKEINELDDYLVYKILNAESIYIIYNEKTKSPHIDGNDNMWIFSEFKMAKNIVEYNRKKGLNFYIKEIDQERNGDYWATHLYFNGIERILLNNGKKPYVLNAKKFYELQEKNVFANPDFVFYSICLNQELNSDKKQKIKIKSLSNNVLDELKRGQFLLPLDENLVSDEMEEIPFEAIPYIEDEGFKKLPLFTDWIKFEKAFPDGYVGLTINSKDLNYILQTQLDIYSIIFNYKSYEYEPSIDIQTRLIDDLTKSINLKRSSYINEDIQKIIQRTPNTAHRISQPVLYKEDKKYYLASFIFYYTKQDIRKGIIDRPLKWIKMDLETGKVLNVYNCEQKDFSNAEFGRVYEVKTNKQYDTSESYYETTFDLLDEVRLDIIKNEQFNKLQYLLYIERVLTSIPHDYERFYYDLTIDTPLNKSKYLLPSDIEDIFDNIEKYNEIISNNAEMKLLVGTNEAYRINSDKSEYKNLSDPKILLENIYYPLYLINEKEPYERLKELLNKFIKSEVPLAFFQALRFIKSEKEILEKYNSIPFSISNANVLDMIEEQLENNKEILENFTNEDSGKNIKSDNLYEECLKIYEDIKKYN